MFARVQQQAGFVELSEFNWSKAEELFSAGSLDPREVFKISNTLSFFLLTFSKRIFCLLQLVVLIPGLLPRSSTFLKTIPPLHELADVSMLARGDAEKVVQFKEFVAQYLEKCKSTITVCPSFLTLRYKGFMSTFPFFLGC